MIQILTHCLNLYLIQPLKHKTGDAEIGNGEQIFGFDKEFLFKCINNNDNEQSILSSSIPTPPTPPPLIGTETLTVIKNVDCQTDPETCKQNPILPSQFNIVIEGNNPSDTNFPGSSLGTDVELEPGQYSISEQGFDPVTPQICTDMEFEAGSTLENNLFILFN